MKIIFTVDCPCGGTATNQLLDLTQDDEGPVEIDFAWSCSQMSLECKACGSKFYTGDIEVFDEDGETI